MTNVTFERNTVLSVNFNTERVNFFSTPYLSIVEHNSGFIHFFHFCQIIHLDKGAHNRSMGLYMGLYLECPGAYAVRIKISKSSIELVEL